MVEEFLQSPLEFAFATVLFVGYSLILLALGYEGYRKTAVLEDYAIGTGRLRAWWIGLSFGATYASANMFIGVPGFAYASGTPGLWWIAVFTGLPFIGIALVAKRFYTFGDLGANRDLTLSDWLGRRFNSPFLRVASGLITLLLAFYVAGQVIGAGTLLERLFGMPYTVGILLSIAIAAVYVAGGGMRSTILTDLLQSAIMIIIAVVVFFSGVWMFGGLDFLPTAIDQIATQNPSKVGVFDTEVNPILFGGPIPVLSVAWLGLTFILLPHLMNRVLAVERKEDLGEFVIASGVGLFFMSAFMQWTGLYALALEPGLEFADAAVPVYVDMAFPTPIAIIITVGLVSAIITTMDSLLQGIASVIANDVYKHGVEVYLLGNVTESVLERGDEPEYIERRSLWAARVGVVVAALAAIAIAFTRPPSLTIITQLGITGLLSGVTAPLIAGYTWKRCTKRGAEAGFVVGFGAYLVLFLGGVIQSFFVVFPIATFLSAFAVIAVTLLQGEDAYATGRWEAVFGTEPA